MLMTRISTVFMMFAFFLHSQVYAFIYTGNDLANCLPEYHKASRGDKNTNYDEATRFQAYVIGVFDTLDGRQFCSPKYTSVKQITAIVAKYLESHPEHWNKPGPDIIVMALAESFPCAKKKK